VSRVGPALLLLLLAGCTTTLERGERLYREGDPLGALATWRSIPNDSIQHEAAQQRISEVEDEFQQLVVRYKQRGRYFEAHGRLAEAIMNYRLALRLQPDDAEMLAHVQELARTLAARKEKLQGAFALAFDAGNLAEARRQMAKLRTLDPIDPELEAAQRRVDEALRSRVEALLTEGRRGFSTGDYASAEENFRAVLALQPDDESAQGYLSYIAQIRSSERARAEAAHGRPRVASRPPASAPDVPVTLRATEAQIRSEGFYQNALAAERAGDPFQAIRWDLRALDADAGHERARRHLSELRARLAPQVDGLIDSGRDAFQQEDLQGALDVWRRALLVDPDNARAQQYVARAERLLANLEQLRADPTVRRNGGRRP
jgi:tetratricopeptide (TPR) repeat protein